MKALLVLFLATFPAILALRSDAGQVQDAAVAAPIVHEADLDAAPAEIFRLFSTSEGVRILFAGADARVDAKVGGDFCVMFLPSVDPTGDSIGTNGAKILEVLPDQKIVFEWKCPPFAKELNDGPLSRVVATLRPLGDDGQRSHLTLRHEGFGEGAKWKTCRDYFDGNWKRIVDDLVSRFALKIGPASDLVYEPAKDGSRQFLAFLHRGPAWKPGMSPADAPRLMNHTHYMASLKRRGILWMGGPAGQAEIGVAILKVPDEAYAKRVMAADPAVLAGTFTFEVKEWFAAPPSEKK